LVLAPAWGLVWEVVAGWEQELVEMVQSEMVGVEEWALVILELVKVVWVKPPLVSLPV